MICGHGPIAGADLAGHPDVDLVVLTGSVKTGMAVATAAAANVVPTVLELGGKGFSPHLYRPSERALRGAFFSPEIYAISG